MTKENQTDAANLEKANMERAASEGNKQVSGDARSAPQTSDANQQGTANHGVVGTRQTNVQQQKPIESQDAVTTSQGLNTVEGRKAQIERTQRELERRSANNEAGQEKLLKADSERHEKNENRGQLSEGDGERKVPDNPTSGMEYNRNTPRMDKNGNKVWD